MPHEGILSEHNLEPGEVVTHITLSPGRSSGFYAIKEKASFDWPVAMAAVSLELDGAVVRSARVCAGAVAPIPWPLPDVERALRGVSLDDDDALRSACGRSVRGAEPLEQNGYKLSLLPVAIRRAVLRASGRDWEAKR
jgi:xanthine dehydrogenase YagS FAD-binding subunit